MHALRERPVNTHLRPPEQQLQRSRDPDKSNTANLKVPRRSVTSAPTSYLQTSPTQTQQVFLPPPRVVISPPTVPSAGRQIEMSRSPQKCTPDSGHSSPNNSPSSIPVPHGLSSRKAYPPRRDRSPSLMRSPRHIRRHSDAAKHIDPCASSTTTVGSDSPTPQNFSRPRVAEDLRQTSVFNSSGTSSRAPPTLKTAMVGKTQRPRMVHNRGTNSASPTPVSSPTFAEKSPELVSPDRNDCDSPETSPVGHTDETASAAIQLPMPDATDAEILKSSNDTGAISISEELTSKFNRHLFPPPQPVRFATSLPSIPSQKSLQFAPDDDSGDNGSSFGMEIENRRSPKYALTRSPSPLSSSSPSKRENTLASISERPGRTTRVPSIGYPSNMERDTYPSRSIDPPEVPRERRSTTSIRQQFVRGAFARPTASTTAKASQPLQHHRSRSRQVMNKLSGIFTGNKRNSAPVTVDHTPNAVDGPSVSRPRSSSDDSSISSDSSHGQAGVNGMIVRDLNRVKALVQTLKSEAENEDDTMRELALRQAAQILQESMICAVEARISATKAEEEAERARLNCEMVSKSVERLLRM